MLTLKFWWISIFMFMAGFFIFSINRGHLLIILLSLEFMVLSLFLMLLMYLNSMDMEVYFLMLFLIFSVCEGVLGISILISMIRTHGNDYVHNYNIL
uniref:NADH-ubiquinone oxidoreductase chain 4L n=1 Tax=Glossosoma caudatum TaxID=2904899 RepID=A0A9E8RSV2_9NEOP|nr:NADH dehydrogenase subunit 4L [Glossosoma caudatum]UZZ43632.1 NADH dehydrogenase subunit 4L [Glossosoma caudatum]